MKCYLTWEQIEKGCCAVLAAFPALIGLAVWVGGADRMQRPAYADIMAFSHQQSWPYATVWTVCAVLLILGKEWIRISGLALTVLMSNLWAGLFLKASISSPDAGITASAAYAGYGVVVAAVLGVVIIHRIRRVNDDRMV